MGQSPSSTFEKLFTLVCTDNTEAISKKLHSCSTPERSKYLSNLSDAKKQTTLLMYAAFYGNMATCRLLLDFGAELFSVDNEGHNVLFYAIAGQSYSVVKYLLETVLKDFDEDTRKKFINKVDHTGGTCLHEAVKIQATSCAELLIKHGVGANIANNDGATALHLAVGLNFSDIVHLLVKQKVELNKKDASGWTPLHIAATHNALEIAQILVTSGANINITDNENRSPLQLAYDFNSSDVTDFLINHGAKEKDASASTKHAAVRLRRRTSQRSNKNRNSFPKSNPKPAMVMTQSVPNDNATFLS